MENHTENEKSSFVKELLQWVAIFADKFLIVNAQIPSGSMENTIMPGDRIIGNRLAYTFSDPQRFDIIIFRYPDDESQLFIKRIIGLPGETVEIIDGRIYINGSDEPLEDVETKEPSVLMKCRRTAILLWATTGTTLWIPATGRTPLSAGTRSSERPSSDTGRSPRSN